LRGLDCACRKGRGRTTRRRRPQAASKEQGESKAFVHRALAITQSQRAKRTKQGGRRSDAVGPGQLHFRVRKRRPGEVPNLAGPRQAEPSGPQLGRPELIGGELAQSTLDSLASRSGARPITCTARPIVATHEAAEADPVDALGAGSGLVHRSRSGPKGPEVSVKGRNGRVGAAQGRESVFFFSFLFFFFNYCFYCFYCFGPFFLRRSRTPLGPSPVPRTLGHFVHKPPRPRGIELHKAPPGWAPHALFPLI
jgi:hypothetical protein